ncbi:MAG: hypothetical protein IJA55_01845 [Clostridia bacterium]|nr:hypothetical protein [Clostridia bacterium]
MKKIISLTLALMMIVCVFASCGGGKTASGDAVTVTVKFYADGKEFYSKEVSAYSMDPELDPTVLDAVQCLMESETDIDIILDNEDNPKTIIGVDEYVPGEDDKEYWDFKIDDDNYGAGPANDTKIKNGTVITWGYMTLDEFKALDKVEEEIN